MRKLSLMLFSLVVFSTIAVAGPPRIKGQDGFEKMKSLAGVWEGEDHEGNPVRVSYKVVSEGSAVMEAIDHNQSKDMMITMYHLDGDRLLMTHYCSAGNQPRMRLTGSLPMSLSFEMFDATNMKSKDDPHMHKLVIKWVDKDHLTQEWTLRANGKDTQHMFTLERKG